MICYPDKLRARLYDERIQVLRELQCLADGEADDHLAAQLGQRLAELDGQIAVEEQNLETEKTLAVVTDGNQFFAERAMSIAGGIARRAEVAMDGTMNPICIPYEKRESE